MNVGNNQGLLIVLSGPSGAGKGTLCKELMAGMPDLHYSISATTRKPRTGEQDGKQYYFLEHEQFSRMVEQNQFLEYAEFCGNFYGTPRLAVEKAINEGKDVILEIEIQGALQIKQRFPQGVFIFIVPPSLEELRARIEKRGTESAEKIKERLAKARDELHYVSEYDYVVENDQIATAVAKLRDIIRAEKLKLKRRSVTF